VPIVEAANVNRLGGTASEFPQDPTGSDWHQQISDENKRKVASMADEEREKERQEIIQQFEPDVGNILCKAREARKRQAGKTSAYLRCTYGLSLLVCIPAVTCISSLFASTCAFGSNYSPLQSQQL